MRFKYNRSSRHIIITGTLPSYFGTFSSLKSIQLEVNHLGGEIPSEWAQLKRLYLIDLSDNDFVSGQVPAGLCRPSINIFAINTSVVDTCNPVCERAIPPAVPVCVSRVLTKPLNKTVEERDEFLGRRVNDRYS